MEKKMTLLEKAKAAIPIKPHSQPTDEEIDLSIAWVKKEITTGQASKALNKPGRESGNVIYKMALSLREAYARKMIIVK